MKYPARCVVFIFIFIIGCSSTQIKKSCQYWLFPPGRYKQTVAVEANGQFYQFLGAAHISENRVELVGLSPLGVTMFSVSENKKNGKTVVKSFIPNFKESDVKFIYEKLRNLFFLCQLPLNSKKVVGGVEIVVNERKNNVPSKLTVKANKILIIIKSQKI